AGDLTRGVEAPAIAAICQCETKPFNVREPLTTARLRKQHGWSTAVGVFAEELWHRSCRSAVAQTSQERNWTLPRRPQMNAEDKRERRRIVLAAGTSLLLGLPALAATAP